MLVVVPLRSIDAKDVACQKTVEALTSNNMRLMSGVGDTLWVLTGKGVNFTSDFGDHWWGYNFSCDGDEVADIMYGNGMGVALLWPRQVGDASRIWYYSPKTGATAGIQVKWPDSLMHDGVSRFFAVDIASPVPDSGFYIACMDGGVVQWSGVGKELKAFLPGVAGSFNPASFRPSDPAHFPDTTRRVLGVSSYRSDSASVSLLVSTPSQLWLFSPAQSTWDSTRIGKSILDDSLEFRSFESVLSSPFEPLYAYIDVQKAGGLRSMMLFRYSESDSGWKLVLRDAPRSIARGIQGYFYTVHNANTVRAYRDTLSDTAVSQLSEADPAIGESVFERRMLSDSSFVPDSVHDIFFAPLSDSTGNLWVASSDGLFLSRGERPGTTQSGFKWIRHSAEVATGLKKTYAVPGILRYHQTGQWDKARFMYNLSKDAQVTIRVYDYNMDLVKTVLDSQPRKAVKDPSKRSSLPGDVWDGTTASGRRVAPGLYYYKITASSGERAFGKVIVAKD